QFGIDHHWATKNIIKGQSPLGEGVYRILRDYNIDIDHLLEIIEGKNDDFDGIFSGPINLDTIDGIYRTRKYFKPYDAVDLRSEVLVAFLFRRNSSDKDRVDQFWNYKQQAYSFIQSYWGLMSDWVIQELVRSSDNTRPDDFYKEERSFVKGNAKLREAFALGLHAAACAFFSEDYLSYKKRKFFVDDLCSFFSEGANRRYKQTKEQSEMLIRRSGVR